ncbi:hypothetical protein P171DRAFT_492272 [Karstenula rhodostoma CBS 690.94]|uniref:Uncharacterized protein n=1 Tax=Karstenula rhodostoma CBS 690.94 TaxID=1392251 RepID=A0A9P4P5T5_9PLEO|nr:hypothetical protein P171DRAFT_492272 [Karstenula rhodostoma CBS 690.94]
MRQDIVSIRRRRRRQEQRSAQVYTRQACSYVESHDKLLRRRSDTVWAIETHVFEPCQARPPTPPDNPPGDPRTTASRAPERAADLLRRFLLGVLTSILDRYERGLGTDTELPQHFAIEHCTPLSPSLNTDHTQPPSPSSFVLRPSPFVLRPSPFARRPTGSALRTQDRTQDSFAIAIAIAIACACAATPRRISRIQWMLALLFVVAVAILYTPYLLLLWRMSASFTPTCTSDSDPSQLLTSRISRPSPIVAIIVRTPSPYFSALLRASVVVVVVVVVVPG